MLPTALSVLLCVVSAAVLLWLLRRDKISLGLPFGYLGLLLLDHLPGAAVQLVSDTFDYDRAEVKIGIALTAIGCACFVLGVFLAHPAKTGKALPIPARRMNFWLFCLFGGWIFTFALRGFLAIPSVGALIATGGALWMLGVLLGLRWAFHRGDMKWIVAWLAALTVFPAFMLLAAGFLSYGAAAGIIVCSALLVSTRKLWRAMAGIALAIIIGIPVFLGYFESRALIRNAVYSGTSLENRIDAVTEALGAFQISDPLNQQLALLALDTRLNQNYFVGLAAERLDRGDISYLDGQSIGQGLMALVPRLLWPDKPVFAGSPEIVAEMTGLPLNPDTSWGVGNVMEFYINFGYAGLILGFVLLGWILGFLDRQAAIAERRGDFGKLMLCFLPAVALIQPLGSIVELSSGGIAALLVAYCWQLAWIWWKSPPRAAGGAPPIPQP